MSQRNSLLVGIIMAICGTVVLGADRMIASADASSGYGISMTTFTYVGLGILAVAAIWLFFVKPKKTPTNSNTEEK